MSYSGISREIFKLAYQVSPIILTGNSGLTQFIPQGMLPIIALTEGINFVRGLLQGAEDRSLNDFFAHFEPQPGTTLIDNQIGTYPFADQAVAANAVIVQPRQVSLKMIAPARGEGGYLTKLATLTALQSALQLHNTTGGTYIVATPGYIFTNCVMTGLRDISGHASKQVQTDWQFDFMQPLLTFAQAEGTQNNPMRQIAAGVPTLGDQSGLLSSIGNMLSGAFSQLAPSMQSLGGMAVPLGAGPVGPVLASPLPPL
jgi:hypothetical protein